MIKKTPLPQRMVCARGGGVFCLLRLAPGRRADMLALSQDLPGFARRLNHPPTVPDLPGPIIQGDAHA